MQAPLIPAGSKEKIHAQKTSGSYVHLSPAARTTPIKTIGSAQGNIGVFALAILTQREKTLPGRFVVAHVEDTTTGQMLEDWSAVTGKRSVYVETTLDDFSNVWPVWALEFGLMMKMWEELQDQSWTGEPDILTKDDLGITGENLVGFKGAVAEMDWNALL